MSRDIIAAKITTFIAVGYIFVADGEKVAGSDIYRWIYRYHQSFLAVSYKHSVPGKWLTDC
jgi:hypothetical protein